MPRRVARSGIAQPPRNQRKSKNLRKRKDRTLNALSIASQTDPESAKFRQHRFGQSELEDAEPRQKKRRVLDDGEEDEGGDGSLVARSQHKRQRRRHDSDESAVSSGSDSEGNKWHVGFVRGGDDEDEELDSDEAFDESDEERFQDYAFRGSKQRKNESRVHESSKGSKANSKAMTEAPPDEVNINGLSEEDGESDDSLGSEAIDLATALDQGLSDEETHRHAQETKVSGHRASALHNSIDRHDKQGSTPGLVDNTGKDELDDDEHDSVSSADEPTTAAGRQKLGRLKDLVASLSRHDEHESEDEGEEDTIKPGALMTALKRIADGNQGVKSGGRKKFKSSEQGPLKAPLPKRQQDKLDRHVAHAKAKKDLDRWQDIVKQNRRAEHLQFPLADSDAQGAQGAISIPPVSAKKPRNELENAINSILQQSGLGSAKREPDAVQEAEEGDELPSNKLSKQEVLERRAELRKMRDLLFREEQRAKRINKIKSKAYRRVHRKERERNAQKERDLMTAAGVVPSEDEQERLDRRRAEERMGARHRESRWAKSIKQTGRAAWDEYARSGVIDMARRDEELRQRIKGDPVDRDNAAGLPSSDISEDHVDGADMGTEDALLSLQHQSDKQDLTSVNAQQSRLGSLKFMQRSDERRKQQNDSAIEDLRRDLAEEQDDGESEKEASNPGRKIFGPGTAAATAAAATVVKPQAAPRNELEEGLFSDSEEDVTNTTQGAESTTADVASIVETKPAEASESTVQSSKEPRKLHRPTDFTVLDNQQTHHAPVLSLSEKRNAKLQKHSNKRPHTASSEPAPPDTKSTPILAHSVTNPHDDDDDDDNNNHSDNEATTAMTSNPTNEDLVRAAFGVDESAETDFTKEKQDAAESEDDRVIDNSLPGWGSWAGAGITRKQKAYANEKSKKHQTKVAGVKAANRKDAKLQNVIVSEKRVRKNAKYLAPVLPHPFESQQQYERSLRLPVGPEWSTKESFQSATKPRILLKQGVIKPMESSLA